MPFRELPLTPQLRIPERHGGRSLQSIPCPPGIVQAYLARRAGIRPETLNRLEQGRHTPTFATIDKLDRALTEAEQAD